MTCKAVIEVLEEKLRNAMLNGDVAALDGLLAEDLLFTDQQGHLCDKTHDLDMHRSGLLKLDRVDVIERHIRLFADSAVVVLRAAIAGRYAGAPVSGNFAFTRVWQRLERDDARSTLDRSDFMAESPSHLVNRGDSRKDHPVAGERWVIAVVHSSVIAA